MKRGDVTGWLDMGAGLARRSHFYREGVAICDSRITWGKDRLARGEGLPPSTACQKCLIAFAKDFD